jgi:pimeloyl-ACP methyl ester carboxylesterase
MASLVKASDGIALAYEVHGGSGAGPFAVVLVHGWAGNRTYWDRAIHLLADRYQVVALDLGGHGESGRGRADWNLPAFGDDVVAVVDDVGADRIALVGHSMGGDAIVYAAAHLDDRVAGIVWVDAFRSLGTEPVSSPEDVTSFVAPFRDDFTTAVTQFARSLFPAGAEPALVDRVAADMAAFPQEVGLGSIAHALNREPPLLAAMSEIEAPMVAINPDIGPTDAGSLRRHGVEPVVLDGVGHYLMLEAPDRFNDALLATLQSFER